MARLEIACPKCGQRLKVPDRSLLGRKARCGKCAHKFVMQESAVRSKGEAAKPVSSGSFEAPLEFADLKANASRGEAAERPAKQKTQRLKLEPDTVPAVASHPIEFPSLETDDAAPFEGIDLSPVVDSDAELFSRRRFQSSNNRRLQSLIGIGVVLLLAGGAAAYFVVARPNSAKVGPSSATTARVEADAPASGVVRHERVPSPTRGKPLSLQYVPMGARIVVHLRPADLWEPGSSGEEFRACLGPLGIWLESQINTFCLVEPAKIEEVLFGLIPASRETFDVAAVVRTRHDVKRSELLNKINGELVDQPRPHYLTDKTAYLLPDARTIAIAPRELASSMLESVDGGGVTSEGIQALLARTDRDRHFTLLAELEDVRIGVDSLAPANARSLLNAVVDFFGENVETVAATFHLGDPDEERDLFAQVLVRNRVTRSPPHLRDDLQKQLSRLPTEMLQVVNRTNPRKLGEKRIVGRFPIMTKVVEQSSVFEVNRRLVSLECRLPERAGPNLALGALLTWNQTTLPEYGRSPTISSTAGASPSTLPGTIAERLQKKIDVEFRDDFLYVAIDFIGEETGVEFKLDGAGMKRAGITQNEKQKFTLEKTPAIAILDRILTPRKLVLIVDEQKKVATITGAEEAADKKLQPFPLKSAGETK